MRRVMLFRIGGRNVHLPKLIGAFLLVAALLMFVRSGAMMFDQWDALKETQNCFEEVNSGATFRYASHDECREMGKDLGLVMKGDSIQITLRQFWGSLLEPIANVFFWAIVFLLGMFFYRTGDLVIPIEQSISDVPDRPAQRPVSEKKKK